MASNANAGLGCGTELEGYIPAHTSHSVSSMMPPLQMGVSNGMIRMHPIPSDHILIPLQEFRCLQEVRIGRLP